MTYNAGPFEIYKTSTRNVFFFATAERRWQLADLLMEFDAMDNLGSDTTSKLVWVKQATYDDAVSREDADALSTLKATYGDKNVMATEIKRVPRSRKEVRNPRDTQVHQTVDDDIVLVGTPHGEALNDDSLQFELDTFFGFTNTRKMAVITFKKRAEDDDMISVLDLDALEAMQARYGANNVLLVQTQIKPRFRY